jgi:hypothetical protein
MARDKISRNDPCPCGSGKKFKQCCLRKGIDWDAKKPVQFKPVPAVPRPADRVSILGPYSRVDAKLKALARESGDLATWKEQVGRLSSATSDEDRVQTYQAIRGAKALPQDTGFFLIAHATQWIFPDTGGGWEEELEEEAFDDNKADEELDQHVLTLLRRFGENEMAELYVNNRLEYDRRYERGRQFFYGPPDEEYAKQLREQGIID